MAKKGRKGHVKRLAAQKSIFLTNKKEHTWLINSVPGPHSKKYSLPLTVFLRDILKITKSAGEAKKILSNRLVEVDGCIRTEEAFPLGLMDVIAFPSAEKYYRLFVDGKSRLTPLEITKQDASKKLLKIVKKHTAPKSKIVLTSHDGRNIIADNKVKVGDSVIFDTSKSKIAEVLKLQKGAKCLIMEGKHAGHISVLEEIIERKGGKDAEAKMSNGKDEFITVAKYLFVVDQTVKGVN